MARQVTPAQDQLTKSLGLVMLITRSSHEGENQYTKTITYTNRPTVLKKTLLTIEIKMRYK